MPTTSPDRVGAFMREWDFGNYGPGRWAWITRDMHPMLEPIPCRGAQGLFDVPDSVVRVWER